jgi:hypothetical protein
MKSVRFRTLGRALIAAVAICAAAPPAKADLLTFSTQNGTITSSATVSNNSTGTTTVGDFSVSYAVTDTLVNGTEMLSVAVTAVRNGTTGNLGTQQLGFDLSGGGYSVGSIGTLTSTINIGSSSKASGASAATTALYTDAATAGPITQGSGAVTVTSTNSAPGSSSASTGVNVNSPFTLETQGSLVKAAPGSTVSFTATAQVHGVPEPSGAIAALAGMPCVGLLLGFARRLRRSV